MIEITHSGKDIEGGCEDLIHFLIYGNDEFLQQTEDFRFDCNQYTVQVWEAIPHGLYEVKLQAEDDSGNLNPKFRYVGWIHRSGYDDSFQVRKDGDWVIFDRDLPNTVTLATEYIEIAVTDDEGVLGEWNKTDSDDSLMVSFFPKNVFHARMNAEINVWSRELRDWVMYTYQTKERVCWFGPPFGYTGLQ